MEKIIRGVHQFQQDIFSSQRELFERLAVGQSPDTLFITCSDSRIDPSLLTQTEPGELFILRNAGNIVPTYGPTITGEIATIEFAVVGLGVKDIIVCGHSHCGAMKGLLEPNSLEKLPSMKSWLQHAETTRHIMQENYADESGAQLLQDTVKENVLVQLDHLRTHPAVAARLASGQLKIHGWVYMIESGEVFAFDPTQRKFMPVNTTAGKARPVDDKNVI